MLNPGGLFPGGFFLLMVAIGVAVIFYGMRIRARRSEQLADLYAKALERGVDPREIKFQLDAQEQGDPQGNLKAGVILLATALSIVLGFALAERLPGIWHFLGLALVPAGIGLALLFIHYTVSPPAK
jgi:hypothetical protein